MDGRIPKNNEFLLNVMLNRALNSTMLLKTRQKWLKSQKSLKFIPVIYGIVF